MSANPKQEAYAAEERPVKKMTLVQAVTDALACEMRRDESVLLLGQDIGVNGGVFRATAGLIDEFGADRVVDTPLAESAIVGTSIGMAMTGLRPVAEIQFMGFVYPAMNQMLSHAGRMRHRTRGRFNVPLVVRMPYGGGIHAPEHHSESYEALFVHSPGIKVVIPSTPHDAKGLLISAIRDEDPVLFMEPKQIYRAFRGDVPTGEYTVPLGEARRVREGTDVTLMAWGAMVRPTEQAAGELETDGVSAEVLDLRTLNPLDVESITSSVDKTGRAVVVHEAPRSVGVGAEIAALIQERCLLQLLAPVGRVAGYDTVMPLAANEKLYLPDARRIVAGVRRTLEF